MKSLKESNEIINNTEKENKRLRETAAFSAPAPFRVFLSGEESLHRCSNCGFGFMVKPKRPFLPNFLPQFTACPKCNNTDEIKNIKDNPSQGTPTRE